MDPKRTCPECNLIFEAPQAETGLLTCPLCDTVFAARAQVDPAPTVPAALSPPPPPASSSTSSASHVLKGCLAVGALLFLVGGLVYAYHLLGGIEPKAASTLPKPALPAPSSEPPPAVEILPPQPTAPPPEPRLRSLQPVRRIALSNPPPLDVEPPPPLTLPERVNRAIDRGVAHLRKDFRFHDQYRNYSGLLGLTLLECGVPRDDPTIKQIAAWMRTRESDLATTYELSLAILFFDRLGETRDRPLIRTFGQRLLAGQLEGGTWTYRCPVKANRPFAADPTHIPQMPQIVAWRNASPFPNSAKRVRVHFHGDNSNTQFAIIGLWVAQRHGVAARGALLNTEQYFRQIQRDDGSWSYHPLIVQFRDSMTCAGLMSLAMRYGAINGQGRDIRSDRPLRVSDRAIMQGLRFLGQSLNKVSLNDRRILGVEARDPLYFLWSLERMAVIYDLKTLGGTEWYPWAAEMLVQTQDEDGRWHAPYPSPVGTCFALLVLKRSNLAHDLQLTVQGQPTRRDAGLNGPTILQGPDALRGSTTTPRGPVGIQGTTVQGGTSAGLGPTVIEQPKAGLGDKK